VHRVRDPHEEIAESRGGFGRGGLGEQQRELVASDAAYDIHDAQPLSKQIADRHEDVVAGFVTQGVVDALEVVEIEEGQRERLLMSAGPFDLGQGRFLETTPVLVGCLSFSGTPG